MVRIISGYVGTQMVDDDAVLDKAVANIKNYFAFVGLVEHMPESVDRLSRKLGFQHRHKIPHRNVNRKSHFQGPDFRTLTAIQKYNRLDIALYEYILQSFTGQDIKPHPIPKL